MAPASRPEPAFTSNCCVNCQAPLQGAKFHPHLCGGCGFPQPVLPGETAFSLLETRPLFGQDEAALRARFYELSRVLHPDRFAASSSQARANSVERMSRINEAFRMLKSKKLLREAILELHEVGDPVKTPGGPRGASAAPRGAPPLELAEDWFELQDAVMEDPTQAFEKIRAFELELEERKSADEAKILEQEAAFDHSEGLDRVALLEISRILRNQAYIDSMIKDVLRLKERLLGAPVGAMV